MAISKNTCYLFTQSFPYGNGEIFLEKESAYLSSWFKNVIIFPIQRAEGLRKTAENVTVCYLFDDKNDKKNYFNKIGHRALLFCKLLISEVLEHPRENIGNFRSFLARLRSDFRRAHILQQYLNQRDISESVFYSYWFDSWALLLSIVRGTEVTERFNYISRAHGFDVFKEQTANGLHPFKKFMLEQVKRVYVVSRMGANYLDNNYPGYSDKIAVAYLGSPDNGQSLITDPVFHIVSCANIRSIKRLDLVCEILSNLPKERPVKWTLIGDGDDLKHIVAKSKNLPSWITCYFPGFMTSEEIDMFYKKNSINLFLSVSRSEGVPFTMIEAISYGIPLMATDVGGCREICNQNTGVLISKNFNPKDVASAIVEFAESNMNGAEFRYNVRRFWASNFNAEQNFNAFYTEICS